MDMDIDVDVDICTCAYVYMYICISDIMHIISCMYIIPMIIYETHTHTHTQVQREEEEADAAEMVSNILSTDKMWCKTLRHLATQIEGALSGADANIADDAMCVCVCVCVCGACALTKP